jgi:hypothetical protein
MSEQLELEMEIIKTDFYLKLASEADMETVLHDFYKQEEITVFDEETGEAITVVDEETGEEITQIENELCFVPNTSDYTVDIVGTIQEPTGNTLTSDEGMEFPEMQEIDGWHVNIRLVGDAMRDIVEALDTLHGVTPEVPKRVWL